MLAICFCLRKTLEGCWERHQQAAQLLHKGLERMGLKLFVKDPVSHCL